MKPRCYISGPITGKLLLNRPAFTRAAQRLAAKGFAVVNPFDVIQDPESWEAAMRADLKAMLDCSHIAMLPGWRDSRGARLEYHVACELGFEVIHLTQAAPPPAPGVVQRIHAVESEVLASLPIAPAPRRWWWRTA